MNRTLKLCGIFFIFCMINFIYAQEPLKPRDVLQTKTCDSPMISPDGRYIAYLVIVPRAATDKAGSAYKELYVADIKNKKVTPYVTGKVNISNPAWSPDGSMIGFLTKRESNAFNQVWAIPVSGGEARQVTQANSGVESFEWHPSGQKVLYIAEAPETPTEKKLKDKGYKFIYYEENLKHKNIYQYDMISEETRQLTSDITVWDFEINNTGDMLALTASPQNLIDHKYMFRKIYTLDIDSGKLNIIVETSGKLGNYAFCPDGSKLVFNAANERKDHQVSQVFVVDMKSR